MFFAFLYHEIFLFCTVSSLPMRRMIGLKNISKR